MDIQIKKLTRSLTDDFLRFFDCDAFSDHEEWAGCYCLEGHLTRQQDNFCIVRSVRRRKAEMMIHQGIMHGYLLYEGEKVVGWCSAADKLNYGLIAGDEDYATDDGARGRTKVLYCIDIAPAYRGQGLARRIIERFVTDAKAEGYTYAEAYPLTDEAKPYQYKGPVRLYEKLGFETLKKLDEVYIVRKTL